MALWHLGQLTWLESGVRRPLSRRISTQKEEAAQDSSMLFISMDTSSSCSSLAGWTHFELFPPLFCSYAGDDDFLDDMTNTDDPLDFDKLR
jgi:hypothetical protein